MNTKTAHFITIDPSKGQKEYFKDLFRYRELFYFLAWRDILVRYKQTILGVLWAVIRPILNMAVFAFVFGKVANLAETQPYYPLFILAGMLPWQLFSGCLIDTSQSLLNNAPMISKVYFPRVILPVSHVIVHCVDFFIGLALLFILFIFTGYYDFQTLFALPLFIGLTILLCLGTGFWLAAATVRFRDVRFIIPFLVQFGLFISPVGYSSFLLPEKWQWVYFLNPMAGIIEGFRWSCFGAYHENLPLAILLSAVMTGIILVSGFQFFRKMERTFADII